MTVIALTATRPPAPLRRGRVFGMVGGALLLALVLMASLAIGAREVSLGTVLDALFRPVAGDTDHLVVTSLRVPRTLIGLTVGVALGLAGALMQGVTRNPLADPGLLGVSSGAALAVVVGITWLGATGPSTYIWFAFGGAALASLVVYGIGSLGGAGTTPVKLALAGAALTAALTSLITLVLLTNIDTLDQYRFWSVGSLAGRELSSLGALWPFIAVGVVIALGTGRTLNLLSLGDDVARGLGQRVGLTRGLAAVAVVLLCGTATALAGPIVMVGLLVPHIARRFTGPDYRWILAYSVVIGPILLIGADIIGRLIVRPGELEAGIIVALIGAPVMIALVRRSRMSGL